MKKSMSANNHPNQSGNTYGASHNNYRPKSENMNSENWFTDHKKLLWGIGGAVALGAGAMILLKNKKNSERYSDTYDDVKALNDAAFNDNLDDEILITTITEME